MLTCNLTDVGRMTVGSTGETSGCSRDQEARCSGTCLPIQDWLGASPCLQGMIFFFSLLEHICTFFIQIAPVGLILPRWGLILPRIPPPTPLLGRHFGSVTLADPNWAKCLKSGQNFSGSVQKEIIHLQGVQGHNMGLNPVLTKYCAYLRSAVH